MKDFAFLAATLVILSLLGGALVCAGTSCTPAERQAFDEGVDLATQTCIIAALCTGRTDIAEACRTSHDIVTQVIGDDPFCPLDGGAQ
jgi:hypothetical protein